MNPKLIALNFLLQFRTLLEKGKGGALSSVPAPPAARCSKCQPDCADNCTQHPVQQGDVTSTEPPLPDASSMNANGGGGGQPEISAYFEAVEHYISSSGWALLEINAEGIIECVSKNIRDLIQFTRQDLHNQSIYSFLHPGDHKIFSPILNNMSFALGGWDGMMMGDEDEAGENAGAAGSGGGGTLGGNTVNDNNNNSLTTSNSNESSSFAGPSVLNSSNNNNNNSSNLNTSSSNSSANTSAGNTNATNNNNNNISNNNNNSDSGGGGSFTTTSNGGDNNNSAAKKPIRSRIRMLVKHTELETMEQKQRRQDKYEDVVIIAAPVRDDGDECSSVLCLITRPEDDALGDHNSTATVTHSQVHHHHNQHINVQQQPQLMHRSLEQLTLKLDAYGKILHYDANTLRDSFQQHLAKERFGSVQELCHGQDLWRLQKHLADALQSNTSQIGMYRLRLGAPDTYVHVKAQSRVFRRTQQNDFDFIMAVHTVLQDNELPAQGAFNQQGSSGLMGQGQGQVAGAVGLPSTSPMGIGASTMMTTTNTTMTMMTMSGGGGAVGGGMMAASTLSNVSMHQQQQQIQQSQMHPNYFHSNNNNNKMMLQNNQMNNNNGGGLGGPLISSVMNGGGASLELSNGGANNQRSMQHRNISAAGPSSHQQHQPAATIKPELSSSANFCAPNETLMDLDGFPHSGFFDIDEVFEAAAASPMSRHSLTPNTNNTSRPPSVSYSPLPTPLTPFQIQPPNTLSDHQTSPSSNNNNNSNNFLNNNNNGGNTPTGNSSSYGGSTPNTSSFSFPGIFEDSQGSSSAGGGKDKSQSRHSQQHLADTTRLRNLLTSPQSMSGGAATAVSPPGGSGGGGQQTGGGGSKKGGGGSKKSQDARQANQILKVSSVVLVGFGDCKYWFSKNLEILLYTRKYSYVIFDSCNP